MGSPDGEGSSDERPRHSVTITRPFWLGVHQVTQGQWQQVMGTTPWKTYTIEGSDVAASFISWDDAAAFCQKLSRKEGKRYRLPTEAEWEYACRAGTATQFNFGDDESQLGEFAWFDGNTGSRREKYAHCVGQKRPNAFGLYDMHGNVWEWCEDWYDREYYKNSPAADPQGPTSGASRVLRGGSWYSAPNNVRCALRYGYTPGSSGMFGGFRLVLALE
jgi:formylglycine-generating enzyme required for sulfatase activity